MENQQQRERERLLLKFGDQVVLGGIEAGGFVSATPELNPQARVEVLSDGATSPPDYSLCRFEVVHKHQYTERNNFMDVLASCGIVADDNDDRHEDDIFLRGTLSELRATKEFRKLAPGVKEDIAAAKLVFDKEKTVNAQEMDRLIGEPVLYGRVVQLRHVASGLFLTVKRTAASVDRGALRLVLSGGHSSSWFRVSSGYKTKPDGDQVSYGEVVSFMSSVYHGMAINISTGVVTDQSMLPVEVSPIVAESRELTCSPLVGRFKVIPHSLHPTLIPGFEDMLPGGAAVRFVHHTTGTILTVTRDGKVQFEKQDADAEMTPTTPDLSRSDALWQLQPEHIEWAGQPGEYNIKYRLIHIHSGKFLASTTAESALSEKTTGDVVEGVGNGALTESVLPHAHLCVTSDQNLSSTLWTFVPMIQGDGFTSEMLSTRSYAYLQAWSGQWLSQAQVQQKKKVFAATEAESLHAVLLNSKRDDFVLEMTMVPEDVSSKACIVRNCLKTIEGFAACLRANHEKIPDTLDRNAKLEDIAAALGSSGLKQIFAAWYGRVNQTLKQMKQMVLIGSIEFGDATADAKDIASYQQMCKESFLIQAVVDALDSVNLRMFFGEDGKAFVKQNRLASQLIKFGTQCHLFIQAVCRDNAAVQNYVGRNFRDKLSAHLGGSVKAADTLAAIYKDNFQQIQDISEQELFGFVDLIRIEGQFPRFMNFLITQCGSAERPVPRNQNTMVQAYFMDSKFVVVKVRLVPSDSGGDADCDIEWLDRTDGSVKTWRCGSITGIHLDDLHTADITEWERSEDFIEKNPEITMFIFFIFQLNLFAAMCYGRNTIAQQTLLRRSLEEGLGCDFETLLELFTSSLVPFALRTACLRLMLHLHIDADPFFEVKVPRTSRLIGDAEAGSDKLQSKETNASFKLAKAQTLKGALINYLQDVMRTKAVACTGQCSLTLMAICTIKRMFQLGILSISSSGPGGGVEALDVLQRVLQTVQPQNDQASNWQIVMEMKAMTCSTLDFCLSLHTEDKISAMFKAFVKASQQRHSEDPSIDHHLPGMASSDEEEGASLVVPEDAVGEHDLEPSSVTVPSGVVAHLAAGLMQSPDDKLFDLDGISLNDISGGLAVTLLELCRHDHSRLSESAIRLLDNLLSRRRQLIRCMIDTLLVANAETGLMYRRCESLLRLLSVEYKWVASMDRNRKLAAIKTCCECFQEMSNMLVPFSNIEVPLQSEEIDGGEAQVSGKLGPLTCDLTKTKSVLLTKSRVTSFQNVLHDLGATDMAMQFLRLPMRRAKPASGKDSPNSMPEAAEPERRDLFGVVYEFLVKLCVYEAESGADLVNNTKIQNYLAKDVTLYMSHVGIQNLNATSTISAIFQNNVLLSRRYLNERIVYRFIQLLVTFGEKKRTRWLTFLRRAAVVGETPVPRNQAIILMAVVDAEDQVLSLCKSDSDKQTRTYAMANNCHLENTESGAEAKGSWLAYHRTSLLLLSDCTIGGDPTLVVKASGLLSLREVLEGATMSHVDGTPKTTTRYVAAGYWQFLQNVYFATDTESARMAVCEADNGIWDSDDAPAAGGKQVKDSIAITSSVKKLPSMSTSVMRWVISEIEFAMEQEPLSAVESDVQFYASAMLPKFVFPALTAYFKRHYWGHSTQLPPSHTKTLGELLNATMSFAHHLRDIHSRNASKALKPLRRSTRDLLLALSAMSNQLDDENSRAFKGKFQGSIMNSMSEGASNMEGASAISASANSAKILQDCWLKFITELAGEIGVMVCNETWDVREVRVVEDGKDPVKYASLHIMSRLLAQPHKLVVERRGARGIMHSLGWTWEDFPLHLCNFLIRNHHSLNWTEEAMVKMVRCMTLACYICDGRGDQWLIKTGWEAGLDRQPLSHLSRPQLKWVQDKYDTLGFTYCAAALMTNAKTSVQMEALRLLATLLSEGNTKVQSNLASILMSNQQLSEAWFGNVEAVLVRCGETLKAQVTQSENSAKDDDDLDEFDDEEDEDPELVSARFNDSHNPFVFASEMITMMTLMCEGHNERNQLMMREQPENTKSVDLLAESVNLMGLMQTSLLESAVTGKMQLPNLMISICEFLTEACLGPCRPIQYALTLDSPLISLFNRTLSTIVIDKSDELTVVKTKARILTAVLQVLYSLLEGSTDQAIADRINDVLDFSSIEAQLVSLLDLMEGRDPQENAKPESPRKQITIYDDDDEAESEDSFSSLPGDPSSGTLEKSMMKLADIGEDTAQENNQQPLFINMRRGSSREPGAIGMSAFELEGDVDAPEVQEQAAHDAVYSALLEVLFFVRKLHYKTGGAGSSSSGSAAPQPGTVQSMMNKAVSRRIDDYMESRTASIELLWNGSLEKVFFPLTEICQKVETNPTWREEVRAYLHTVPSECRGNPLQKAIKLMHLMDGAVADLAIFEHMNQNYKWCKYIVDNQRTVWQWSFYVAVLILTIMTLTVRESANAWKDDGDWSYWVCIALSGVQLLLMALIVVSFVFFDAKRWLTISSPEFGSKVVESLSAALKGLSCRRTNRVADSSLSSNMQSSMELEQRQMASSFSTMLRSGTGKAPGFSSQSNRQSKKILAKITLPPKNEERMDIYTLAQQTAVLTLDTACFWKTWYILALLASAILAINQTPFYTSLFLTVFFLEFSAGKTIIRALGEAGMPLLKTCLMGVVVIIWFSVGSYVFFREAETANLKCTTMYQCVGTHLITGMYGDFAALFHEDGDIYQHVPFAIGNDPTKQLQIFFVLGFFIIWGFVLSNIFTGQVVDAFASIRAEEENVQSDNTTHCLMCSLERFEFDKNPQTSFDHHVDCEHNPLAYVYYMHYLKETKSTLFKGYDTAVHNIMKRESVVERTSWLPINRSITLENLEAIGNRSQEEANEKQTDLLHYLQSMIQRMDARINGLEMQLNSQ